MKPVSNTTLGVPNFTALLLTSRRSLPLSQTKSGGEKEIALKYKSGQVAGLFSSVTIMEKVAQKAGPRGPYKVRIQSDALYKETPMTEMLSKPLSP